MKTNIKAVVSYRYHHALPMVYDVFYTCGRIKTFCPEDLPKTVQAYCDGAYTELIKDYALSGFPGCKYTRPEWELK